ncbi:MAG: protein kinase domain-containing protein [Aureliella sp.]
MPVETATSDIPKQSELPQLADFELISRIGKGGMGIVYRALQRSLGREVALKCLLPSGDPASAARFAREVHALAKVAHPHLVKVYSADIESDHCYYVMELIDGANMEAIALQLRSAGKPPAAVTMSEWQTALEQASRIARSNETPIGSNEPRAPVEIKPPEAYAPAVHADEQYITHVARLMAQVADAVSSLHREGIVHRDIKPGNIMIRQDGGSAVLMDLGLAHIRDDATSKLTRTRQFLGTVRYASPEQVLAVGPVDYRSDIYSLGASLWEMLTLRPIFGEDDESSTYEIMRRIEYEEPPSVRKYNRAAPVDIASIVGKCLDKNPTRRYQSAAELVGDLENFVHGKPVRARPLTIPQRVGKVIAKNPLRTGIAFLSMVSLLLVLFIVMQSRNYAKQKQYIEQLNAANERADTSFRDALTALDGIFELVSEGELRNRPDLQPLRTQLLRYYEQYISRGQVDNEMRLDLALAHERLARITGDIGDRQQALREYANALALIQKADERTSNGVASNERIGRIHIQRAILLIEQREYLSAASELDSARAALSAEKLKASPTAVRLLAEAYHQDGILQMELGHLTDSLKQFLEGLRLREALLERDHSRVNLRDVGRSYGYLGDVQLELGDYGGAEQSYVKSVNIREELVAQQPDDDEAVFQLARGYRNLGHLNQLKDKIADAITWFARAVSRERDLARQHPAVIDYRADFGEYGADLAELLVSNGNTKQAQTLLEELVPINDSLVAANAADMRAVSSAIHAFVYLTKIRLATDAASAKESLRRARELASGRKQPTANDLFNEAMLEILAARIERPDGARQVAMSSETAARASALLDQALQRNENTIRPRLKRESLFDSLVLTPERGTAVAVSPELAMPGASRAAAVATPKALVAVTIGVSDYQVDSLDLRFGESDAKSLAGAFEQQQPYFEDVVVETLTNQKATRAAILDLVARTRQRINKPCLFVLTLSGHGLMNNLGEYYFAPYDFDPQGSMASTGLSWYDLEQEFKQVPGVVMVVLDTCHGGSALESGRRGVLVGAMDRSIERAVKQMASAGVEGTFVLASSLSGQLSEERPEWGHGALTLAVLEALTGQITPGVEKIDLPPTPDGRITAEALRNYSVGRVNQLTQGRQQVITKNTVDLLRLELGAQRPRGDGESSPADR